MLYCDSRAKELLCAEGTVLLYDPRKLAAPWDQTTCPGLQPIKDLHWQHTAVAKSAKTAVKADPHARRSMHSSAEGSAMPSTVVPEQSSAVLATPAPATHVSTCELFVATVWAMHGLKIT